MARPHPTTRTSASARGGLLRRTYEAMLGARQHQANQYARYHLLALDDASLAALGYTRSELRDHGGGHPSIF